MVVCLNSEIAFPIKCYLESHYVKQFTPSKVEAEDLAISALFRKSCLE